MSLFVGGTGSSNELHDYEEGTFSMSLTYGSNTSNTGRYVKIGQLVWVRGNISLDNVGAASHVTIDGLPFTVEGHSLGNLRGYNAGNISNSGMRPTNCVLHENGTNVMFGTMESAQAWSMLQYNDFSSANSPIYFTCVYSCNA